ncbi:MAG: hypothetical protein DRO23_07680 [Thermoprotei archaeon]|nr:MAG: hypothetical protein DRO23_07680 [Thermoprotei archaeon]
MFRELSEYFVLFKSIIREFLEEMKSKKRRFAIRESDVVKAMTKKYANVSTIYKKIKKEFEEGKIKNGLLCSIEEGISMAIIYIFQNMKKCFLRNFRRNTST